MNHRKICFITCVNDYEMYNESLKYIHSLNLPEEFEIETLVIDGAKSMTSGYNDAMKKTDAKYKVYLHQDVFIINKNFIHDIVNIFKSDDKIGILGVAGANTIPTNAAWWESAHRFGKSYENHSGTMKLLEFDKVENNFQEVKALDGLLLATQHDIPWREDIFNGWHFYDLSQCVEFTLKGYKAVVPRQDEPWCIHDCGFVETTGNYEIFKEVFLDEYSKDIFPLVSILIPTHNRPHFFKVALESAINQTYRNIEVVISDNSDNEETKTIASKYLELNDNIKYIFEPNAPLGKNWSNCLMNRSGEFINFLMDDDYFHIDKISKMMNYFIEYDDIKIVTSHRQVIDSNGNFIRDISATQRLFDSNKIIDGEILGNFILTNSLNIIGEPTTTIFRESDLVEGFGIFLGHDTQIVGDVATWLQLLSQGKCAYIHETLSYFRLHSEQDQNNIIKGLNGVNDWYSMAKLSYQKGLFFHNEKEYNVMLNNWLNSTINLLFTSNLKDKSSNNLENLKIKLYGNIKDALKRIIFDYSCKN